MSQPTKITSLRDHGRYTLINYSITYLTFNVCRSKTMLSLVDFARPASPTLDKKAKEAEDVKGEKSRAKSSEEEDELIVMRRTISLLNAQKAVHTRETSEALERKDREILNLQNEITNIQQALASERLARKKTEERIETLEDECHKLRRLALAYKTKFVKSNINSSADLKQPTNHNISSNTTTSNNTTVGNGQNEDISKQEQPVVEDGYVHQPNQLVSSFSTSSVPDLRSMDQSSFDNILSPSPSLSSLSLASSAPLQHKKSHSDLSITHHSYIFIATIILSSPQ